jgi:hypothetical protein
MMQDLENNRKGLADYLLKSKKELEIKTSKKIIESIVKFQANETKTFLQHCLGIKNRYQNLKTMNIFRSTQNIILTCFIFQQRRINLFSAPRRFKIILDDPTSLQDGYTLIK